MENIENLLILNQLIFDYLGNESDSESDGDDDDLDLDIINYIANNNNQPKCYCLDCRPRIPRIQNFIELVIDQYSDVQFQQNFR